MEILTGDALTVLRTLPEAVAQTVVTSPPYFRLRDYGTASWHGGDPDCDHVARPSATKRQGNPAFARPCRDETLTPGYYADSCPHCGARKVDYQVGIEDTPEEYVNRLVMIFREVKRVLRDDGTVWINIGDSYSSHAGSGGGSSVSGPQPASVAAHFRHSPAPLEIPQKNLLGIPWRLAFALQADGWILRSAICWEKPNPMPESVKDRPTSAYEMVFLLAKNPRYFYDADAIREKPTGRTDPITSFNKSHNADRQDNGRSYQQDGLKGANARNVWKITPKPFKAAHFAVMPTELAAKCIKAGTAPLCCAKCGAPHQRMQKRTAKDGRSVVVPASQRQAYDADGTPLQADNRYNPDNPQIGNFGGHFVIATEDAGWQPSCACDAGSKLCMVLDPFGGAGTTGLAAKELERDFTLIELNPDYVEMAKERLGLNETSIP